ncbi:MAG: hypothetical protein V3R77_06760 [Candidatus Binatia bacterium]
MSVAQTPTPFRNTWRYKAGLTLIAVGHLILLVALLLPMLGFGVGVGAVLAVIGEGMCMLSIVFLGKEGFLEIKHRIVKTAREGFEGAVGRGRFRTGVALIVYNTLALLAVELLALQRALRATSENPDPGVLGIAPEVLASSVVFLVASGEVAFIFAIYVLGGDWWDRFRALFVWKSPVAVGRD